MKITVLEDERRSEIEIVINCNKADEKIQRLVSVISNCESKLTVSKDGAAFVIAQADVLYFESVDKRTFAYTENEVYEIQHRLYELEELLAGDFFRASKAAVINISKIRSIVPDFGGRLFVTLVSGERITVSRQYAHELKNKLKIQRY